MTEPTNWPRRPAKTPISLGIDSVWSESSLAAWRSIEFFTTHRMHSKDWSDAQADLSLQHRLIGLGRCPGWSESSLSTKVILLHLSCFGSFFLYVILNDCECENHIGVVVFFYYLGKDCRSRIDVAECGIWSGSTLFAYENFYLKQNNNEKLHQTWENLFMLYANNKGADQPAHPRSLTSAFVVRCLDDIIPRLVIAEISRP